MVHSLLRLLLWTFVVVAPGGLLLLPVVALGLRRLGRPGVPADVVSPGV